MEYYFPLMILPNCQTLISNPFITNITTISEKTEIKIEIIEIKAGSLKDLSLKIEKRYFFDKK